MALTLMAKQKIASERPLSQPVIVSGSYINLQDNLTVYLEVVFQSTRTNKKYLKFHLSEAILDRAA